MTYEEWEKQQVFIPHAGCYLPLKHAYIIRANWKLGKPWWLCSPLFNLSRADVAFIVTAPLK